jgi:hypothetical protein
MTPAEWGYTGYVNDVTLCFQQALTRRLGGVELSPDGLGFLSARTEGTADI